MTGGLPLAPRVPTESAMRRALRRARDVNPERPWPEIGELSRRTAQAGFRLRERLTIYPEYILVGEPWLDPRLRAHVMALADGQGMAAEGPPPRGLPWQEPDGGFGGLAASGRTELHVEIDTTGRTNDRRGDFDAVYGNWGELQARATGQARKRSLVRFDANVLAALRHAADSPGGVGDDEALALLSADGPEREALAKLADDVRRDAVGDEVTYVVTRNTNFTNVCYTGCRFCAFAQRRTDAGLIRNIQCSWVKLGVDGCRKVLQGGVNDVGGTLMGETISRMAGSQHGSYKTISDIQAMVAPTGRPLRQRTTTYGEVPPERHRVALASDGVCTSIRRLPVL